MKRTCGYRGRRHAVPLGLLLAALCALLALAFLFFYTPMRFSGCLLLCAAVYFVLWHFLWLRREHRLARAVLVILAALLIGGLAVFTVLEAQIIGYGRTDRESPVSAVVVLGAGVNGTKPSLALQSRLEAALDYFSDRPEVPIVVTGSQGPGEDISEGRCMADWLIARGVDEGRILVEEQADNTEENVAYAKALLARHGVDAGDAVAVVSADYHLYRAHRYWGEDMVPVAAHMPAAYWPLTANYYIREAFAVAKQNWL